MKKSTILFFSFLLSLNSFAQNKPEVLTIKISIPDNPIVSIKNDVYNPDEVIQKTKSEFEGTKHTFGQNRRPNLTQLNRDIFGLDAVHTVIASGNERYLDYCVVTEQSGNTAGTIWAVAVIQSVSLGNDRIVIYKFEQNSWVETHNFYSNRYLDYTIDAEIIEPNNGGKFLWFVVVGLPQGFAKREIILGGLNLQNITESYANYLNWPGYGPPNEYYNPQITTDNASDQTYPWIFIVASFDSITTDSKHVYAQKFAHIENPWDVLNPNIIYRPEILPIYWPAGGTTESHYLYSDIAYLNSQGTPKLIFTYSNVPDNTQIWLSSCSINGTNAAAMGAIDGNGPYQILNSAIASPGGINQNQLMVVFEENYQNSGDWDLVSVRSNDGGSNWLLNYIESSSSTTDFLPHLGSLTSRRGVLDEYYLSYSINDYHADSVMSVHSNSGASSFWDSPVKMSFTVSDYIQSSVGITNTPGERLTVWSHSTGSTTYQLNGSFYPGLPSSVDDERVNSPNSFRLQQNYPNPFNPSTKISYSIPELSLVTLKVYDVLGNEIATLVNEEKSAGSYEVDFNAANLPSGIYFYKLEAGNYTETKKMVLLK